METDERDAERERSCHEIIIDGPFRGCSNCGSIWESYYYVIEDERPLYCPRCGAKIKEGFGNEH